MSVAETIGGRVEIELRLLFGLTLGGSKKQGKQTAEPKRGETTAARRDAPEDGRKNLHRHIQSLPDQSKLHALTLPQMQLRTFRPHVRQNGLRCDHADGATRDQVLEDKYG